MRASATSSSTRSTSSTASSALAAARDHVQEVLIRVTPGVAGDTHDAISTGQANSKFGFSLEDAREAIARLAGVPHLKLVGLHFHIGSQLFELEPFRAAVSAIATLGDFPVYNLGGGLGVGVPATSARRRSPTTSMHSSAPCTTSSGRTSGCCSSPAGRSSRTRRSRIYSVLGVKRNVSTWVAVDGGMSDNLRPMLYNAPYEAIIADRPLAPGTEVLPGGGQALRIGRRHRARRGARRSGRR